MDNYDSQHEINRFKSELRHEQALNRVLQGQIKQLVKDKSELMQEINALYRSGAR